MQESPPPKPSYQKLVPLIQDRHQVTTLIQDQRLWFKRHRDLNLWSIVSFHHNHSKASIHRSFYNLFHLWFHNIIVAPSMGNDFWSLHFPLFRVWSMILRFKTFFNQRLKISHSQEKISTTFILIELGSNFGPPKISISYYLKGSQTNFLQYELKSVKINLVDILFKFDRLNNVIPISLWGPQEDSFWSIMDSSNI